MERGRDRRRRAHPAGGPGPRPARRVPDPGRHRRAARRRPHRRETGWSQILAWYDELLELAGNPVAALSRAVAVGEVDGPLAGLAAVEELATRLGDHHRLDAVRARLHERAGHLDIAAEHYTRAAARARNTAERDYLTKQAARLRHR